MYAFSCGIFYIPVCFDRCVLCFRRERVCQNIFPDPPFSFCLAMYCSLVLAFIC